METLNKNPTQALHELGQSLWLDQITRELLRSGTLQRYIDELSVTGLTSNPTIFQKAIGGSDAYDEDIRRMGSSGSKAESIAFELIRLDLTAAAELFAPVHAESGGRDGWVSLEVSPALAYDAQRSVEQARQLHASAAKRNLFIKIPGTREGLTAIEEAIFAGVPVNVTLLFSRQQYLDAADAYMRGLERRLAAGLDADVHSVASLFVSRWDKAVHDKVPAELRNRLGVAIGRQGYLAYRQLLESPRWRALAERGAAPQRLLFGSTGTKDPNASDVLYVEGLAAPGTINTMPDNTLLAFADHGNPGRGLPRDVDPGPQLEQFVAAGIDLDALAAQLQEEGAQAFVDSWNQLLASIDQKIAA